MRKSDRQSTNYLRRRQKRQIKMIRKKPSQGKQKRCHLSVLLVLIDPRVITMKLIQGKDKTDQAVLHVKSRNLIRIHFIAKERGRGPDLKTARSCNAPVTGTTSKIKDISVILGSLKYHVQGLTNLRNS